MMVLVAVAAVPAGPLDHGAGAASCARNWTSNSAWSACWTACATPRAPSAASSSPATTPSSNPTARPGRPCPPRCAKPRSRRAAMPSAPRSVTHRSAWPELELADLDAAVALRRIDGVRRPGGRSRRCTARPTGRAAPPGRGAPDTHRGAARGNAQRDAGHFPPLLHRQPRRDPHQYLRVRRAAAGLARMLRERQETPASWNGRRPSWRRGRAAHPREPRAPDRRRDAARDRDAAVQPGRRAGGGARLRQVAARSRRHLLCAGVGDGPLRQLSRWGEASVQPAELMPEDCWALHHGAALQDLRLRRAALRALPPITPATALAECACASRWSRTTSWSA